jgi:hypothetical protein
VKDDSPTVYSFVQKIFEMLGHMAEIRADPVLKQILKCSQELIDEEKEKENFDFHSDDEDEKCIDLSTDS